MRIAGWTWVAVGGLGLWLGGAQAASATGLGSPFGFRSGPVDDPAYRRGAGRYPAYQPTDTFGWGYASPFAIYDRPGALRRVLIPRHREPALRVRG